MWNLRFVESVHPTSLTHVKILLFIQQTLVLISQCRGDECWGLWKPVDEHRTASRGVQRYHLLPEPDNNSCPGECFWSGLLVKSAVGCYDRKVKYSSVWHPLGNGSVWVITGWHFLLCYSLCFLWLFRKTALIYHIYKRIKIAGNSVSSSSVVFSCFKDMWPIFLPKISCYFNQKGKVNVSVSPRDNLVAPRAKDLCPALCLSWRRCYQITTNGVTTLMEWERKLVRIFERGEVEEIKKDHLSYWREFVKFSHFLSYLF